MAHCRREKDDIIDVRGLLRWSMGAAFREFLVYRHWRSTRHSGLPEAGGRGRASIRIVTSRRLVAD